MFFGGLLVLYVLSRVLTKLLSQILYAHTRSQNVTIYITALIFFPGVVIHELSHFLAAVFTGVRAHGIEFLPKMIDGRLKLGSVKVQQTDPVRRTIIAVAPVFGGCLAILLGIYIFREYFADSMLVLFLTGLFIYQVSNTMFSSKKDIEGTGIFVFFLSILGVVLWFFQVPVGEFFLTSEYGLQLQKLFERGSYYLGIAVVIDCIVLIALTLIKKLSRL